MDERKGCYYNTDVKILCYTRGVSLNARLFFTNS